MHLHLTHSYGSVWVKFTRALMTFCPVSPTSGVSALFSGGRGLAFWTCLKSLKCIHVGCGLSHLSNVCLFSHWPE